MKTCYEFGARVMRVLHGKTKGMEKRPSLWHTVELKNLSDKVDVGLTKEGL